jgi:hypothetical protein
VARGGAPGEAPSALLSSPRRDAAPADADTVRSTASRRFSAAFSCCCSCCCSQLAILGLTSLGQGTAAQVVPQLILC